MVEMILETALEIEFENAHKRGVPPRVRRQNAYATFVS